MFYACDWTRSKASTYDYLQAPAYHLLRPTLEAIVQYANERFKAEIWSDAEYEKDTNVIISLAEGFRRSVGKMKYFCMPADSLDKSTRRRSC